MTGKEYVDEFMFAMTETRKNIGDSDVRASVTAVILTALEPFCLPESVGLLEMCKTGMLIRALPEVFWPKPTT